MAGLALGWKGAMSPQPSLSQLLRLHDDLRRLLNRITPDDLASMWHRAREDFGHDGYPSIASGSGEGGGAGTGGTSVERAVLGRLEHAPADPMRQWSQDIFVMLGQMHVLALGVDARRQAIVKGREVLTREGRMPACVVCGEPAVWADRPSSKAGRCQRCWWHRYRHDHDWRPGCCSA